MRTFKQFTEMVRKIDKRMKNLNKKTDDYRPLDKIPNPLFSPPGNPIDKIK